MQKKTLLLLLALICLSFQDIQAQRLQSFSDNDQEFIEQLNSLLDNLDRQERNRAQVYLDTFATIWTSGTMLDTQKQWVHQTMNKMLGMRLRPWPDYALYLEGVIKVLETRHADRNFDIWHQSFDGMLNTANQRRLLTFWEKSVKLFEQNILYSSSTVTWQIKSNDFVLEFENDSARVVFNETDLVCFAQNDSTLIHATQGWVDLFNDHLYAQGGRLTWSRVELNPDEVFALLSSYDINLSRARFEADSVTFYNYNFFNEPLEGVLSEQVLADMKPETARFPRFQSYKAVHEIRNIFQGVDFLGGFTMIGQRVLGSSTDDGDATLNFYRADSLFISVRGRAFSIRADRIVSDRASVSIYLSGDSIYHPAINVRYLHPTREFSLQRDEKGFSRAPFTNTFHQIDMYCEAIYWNIDSYDIEMRMIRGMSDTGQAVFESHNFFSDLRYMRMQGISGLHPLIRIRNFAREYGERTFPLREYARFLRQDPGTVTAQVLSFSYYGFLSFNSDTEMITLHDRLEHYITAYTGRSDFDVIQIMSDAPVNARINMNNFDLHMYGVERIPLSREKNVVLHPAEQQVIMKKNRDIYFDGRIESGLFDFYGKEFFFDYDQFKIDLVNTDSMSFSVQAFEDDVRGRQPLVRVRTVLEGINGELLVDHPQNKSGQRPYPRYPIFNSSNESYVYYDREFVQEGVYRREDVYFKLIPFSIDSLDNATTDNIAFDGVFISTGIFPDFYDYLTVQKDYSLGFNTQTPDDGYPIYGGKALYKGPIDMSYEGLRADGQLEYLNANMIANNMLMFPDSARGQLNTFNLTAQAQPVEYPELKARDVNMLYLPHEDNLSIKHTTRPMELYAGLAMLEGSVDLTPEGLMGSGRINLFGAQMLAQDFQFKQNDFSSDRTDITLLARDSDQPAMQAMGYKTFVDVQQGNSQLQNIENQSRISFPVNRFDAYGYDLDWDLHSGEMQMANVLQAELNQLGDIPNEQWIDYDFSGHELISTHPGQDSLRFFAAAIDYSTEENVIHASGVKLLRVADAAIFPDQGEVEILERAEFRKLQNAEILANTTSRYHRFYNAEVNIASRWNYSGNGSYDFVNETGQSQTLFFETINVDRANRSTFARAEIEEEQDFTLSPRFGYKGQLELTAYKQDFFYKGASRIFLDCPSYQPDWFRFEAEINTDSIFIPLAEDLRNDANGRIHTALMLAGDSVHIYPAVFARQKHYADLELITSKGYITWEPGMRQYQISTPEKLANAQLPDNIITINPANCVIDGHGDIALSSGLGQFKMETYGRITHRLNTDETELDLVMGIDFFFLSSALALTENAIRAAETNDNTTINLNRFKFTSYLQKQTGKDAAGRLMEEYLADGAFRRFPAELNHTFFFADLKMKWDQNTTTFYTTAPLGIGNMERFPLNQYMTGFLELRKHRGGDIFNLIIIPSGLADEGVGKDWFFFTYTNGIMQTLSSDNEFNNQIRNVNPRRRRMDVDRGEQPFSYILSSDRRPFDFVRTMRSLQE